MISTGGQEHSSPKVTTLTYLLVANDYDLGVGASNMFTPEPSECSQRSLFEIAIMMSTIVRSAILMLYIAHSSCPTLSWGPEMGSFSKVISVRLG